MMTEDRLVSHLTFAGRPDNPDDDLMRPYRRKKGGGKSRATGSYWICEYGWLAGYLQVQVCAVVTWV
jgi:hypothetical protein